MSEFSGRPRVLKRLNKDLIKNKLKSLGSATKAQLAQETELSLTTVGLILGELVNTGEVLNQGFDVSSGGRRAERYSLNLNYSLAVALCVEGEYIDYAVGNSAGDFIDEGRVEIRGGDHMKNLRTLLDGLIEKHEAIACMGLGVPSAVKNGCLFTGKKLKKWFSINVQEYLEETYELPVIIENDLNASAIGYAYNRLREAGIGPSGNLNMAYVHLTSDGTAAGIIANGKLIRGFSNFAGELGHLRLASGKSLDNLIDESTKDEEYAEAVALEIAALNCVVNPEYIVIGGDTFRTNTLGLIHQYCEELIPKHIRPELILGEDSRLDYISGVMQLTIEEMNWKLRLVKSR